MLFVVSDESRLQQQAAMTLAVAGPKAVLENRVRQLERLEESRARREMLSYSLVAVYVMYKVFNWLRDR